MRRLAPSLLVLLAGCGGAPSEAPPEPAPPAYRGDALIVRLVSEAADAHGVPRDVLLALGWAETRLVPRAGELPPGAHDADEIGDEHWDDGAICGLFGLDEGSARDEAAALAGAGTALLCAHAELEANAAAARLRALAGGDDAPALDDTRAWLDALDEWHPTLAESDFPYGDYVAQVMSMGFRGEDEVGAAIYLPPVDGLAELPPLTSEDDVGASIEYARPDTPLADWQGPACDYTPASRGRGDIRYVVIHTCEGGFAGCVSTLRNCGGSRVSAHYVTSYTGYTAQLLEERHIGWHVGCLNSSSVGIEHEGYAGSTHHPDAQMCRTARIVRSVCDRYGIPCDRSRVIGHVEANRLFCHGSHWDPGPHWDWARFMNMVNHGCGCTPRAETCDGRDDDCDRRVDEGVTNRCGTCGAVPAETCNGRDDDCDGTVDENVCDRADPSGDALPDGIDLGTTVRRTITFRNSGTTTWRPGDYRIAASASGADVALSGGITDAVAPGGRASVQLDVTAEGESPLEVTVEVRRDGRGLDRAWRGASTGRRPAFAARMTDVSAPMVLDAGGSGEVLVTVRNEGRAPFAPGTIVAALGDGPFTIDRAPLPLLAPAESARVSARVTASVVRVETLASVTLVVRDAAGATPGWPERGRTIEIGVVPRAGAAAGPSAEAPAPSRLIGGCSAGGGGAGGGWLLALALALFVARRRAHLLAVPATLVVALSAPGCTGVLCDSDAACALTVASIDPPAGSARGGEVVVIEGLGLSRVAGVRFGERAAAVLSRGDERLVVRTPASVAGETDVVIELDDGGERTSPAAFRFEPLVLGFDEAALPEDSVEQRDAVSADFDQDGDLDLLIVVRGGAPRLLWNDGAGAFEPAPEGSVEAPEVDAVGVAAADVDGDGDTDVFVPVYGQGSDLLLRNEAGRLVHDPTALPADATSDHAAVFGDLDGDGDADLVVGQSGRDAEMRMGERVLLNDGAGAFTVAPAAIEDRDDRTTGLALGDVDGDGALDLVLANDGPDDAHVRLLIGRGDGTFADAEAGAVPAFAERTRRPLLGDLDGDGDLDVLAIGHGQDHLLLNDGAGHFYDATFLTLPTDGALAFGGALADVDLDGDLDAVIAHAGAASRLLVNDGAGRLRDGSTLLPEAASPTRQVVVADVDGEGAPDLVWIEGPETRGRVSLARRAAPGREDDTGVSRQSLTIESGCSAAPGRPGAGWIGALALLALVLLRRRSSTCPTRPSAHVRPDRARVESRPMLAPERSRRSGLLLLAALAGCAAPAPSVESMSPSIVSARGGETLVLTGRDLDLADVRLGGERATIVLAEPERLEVLTPPLIAGVAEVEIVSGERRAWAGELTVEPLPVRFSAEPIGEPIAARHVVLSDLDGDGDLDAAVALRDRLVTIFLNEAGALREARELVPEGIEGHAMDLAAGDLDGDGRPDLYVVTAAGESDRLLLQGEDGRFTLAPLPEDLAQATSVVLADLDGDGALDVVTARWRSAEESGGPRGVRVLRNDGGGAFSDVTPAVAGLADDPSFGVAAGDLDGDGQLDLFVANDGAPSRLLLGRPGARFVPALGVLPETAWQARSPASADIDGDGDLDLVLATLGRDVLLRNDGHGRFGDATRFAMGSREAHTESITAHDLDRDGDLDLIGAGYGSGDNVLALSDDGRWFADYAGRLAMLPEGTEVRFAAGDLDGDGDPDLVIGATGSPLTVLRHDGGEAVRLEVVSEVRIDAPVIFR